MSKDSLVLIGCALQAAIHEAKTVGWTQNRVCRPRQNVLLMNKYTRRGAETGGPGVSHLRIDGTQMEFNGFWRRHMETQEISVG